MSQRVLLLSTQRDADRAEEPRLATRACLRLHSGAVAAVESQSERDGAHYELCTQWKASPFGGSLTALAALADSSI
jgi:hypothetical protein